jgi:hypothetical protein
LILLAAAASLGAVDIAAYPWPDEASPLAAAFAPDGSLYVSGRTLRAWEERNQACASGPGYKAFVAKISTAGEMNWVYCVPAGNAFASQPIAVDKNGAAYMAFDSIYSPFPGFDNETPRTPTAQNLYLVALEPSGKVRFGRYIRDVNARDVRIGVDQSGAVYLAGPASDYQFRPTADTVNSQPGNGVLVSNWLVKVRPDGNAIEYTARPSLKSLRDIAILPDGSVVVLGVGAAEEGERFVHGARTPLLKTRISNDAGQSWTQYSSDAPEFNHGEMVVHPQDPDILFATGFKGELVRSGDAGRSWEVWATPGDYIRSVRIHPRQPSRMWALIAGNFTGEFLYRSDDAGRTWARGGDCNCRVSDYALDPEDPDKLWIAVHNSVLRSFNGGLTWQFAAPERFSPISLWSRVWRHPTEPDRLYSFTNAGLAESRDDGEHWVAIMPYAPDSVPRPGGSVLLFDAADPATFYMIGSQSTSPSWSGVLRSSDRGRTWEKMARINALRLVGVNDGATVLYCWTSSLGLARSTDGGATFTSVPLGDDEERYAVSGLVVAPSDNRRMYLSQHHGTDVFVSRLQAGATAVEWTSWVGTFGAEDAATLAVDCSGVIHVGGWTNSLDIFPDGAAIGERDIFIAGLEPDGSALRSMRRVGGSANELPRFLSAGCDGSVFIGALTNSRDLPGTQQAAPDTSGDMNWVAALSASGDAVFATYIGPSTSTALVGAAFTGDAWKIVTHTPGSLNVLSGIPGHGP